MLGCRRKDLITFYFCRHSSRNLKNILKKNCACQVDVLIDLKISLSPKTCRSSHWDLTPIPIHHYRTQSLYSQLNQMTLPSLPDTTVYNLKIPTFYSINLFRHQKSLSLGQGTDNNIVCSLWERNGMKRASEVKICERMTEILGKEPEIFSN